MLLWSFCPSMCLKGKKDGKMHVETFTRSESLMRHVERLDGTAGYIQRTFLLTVTHNPCANQVWAVDTFKKLFYENLD